MSAELPRCTVLATGTMGAQIALSLAIGGAEVRLWGRRAITLPDALTRCEQGFDTLTEHGLAEAGDRKKVLASITTHPELAESVAGSGFIIEAAIEDLQIKQDLLKRAEAVAASEAILSSTTSGISATRLQSALVRPQNFCIAHYAQPAHLVELVEVVPGTDTSESATAETTRILKETGKIPVLCPDIPGFLWARIQHAILREFATLIGKGLVTPEACDTILKVGYASRLPAMGAFEHADLAGLDLINSPASRAVWSDLSRVSDPDETPVGSLHSVGKLGMKSGEGFYDWNERDPAEFLVRRDEEIIRRIKINRGGEVELIT